jgi:hypothetical protein
MRMEAYFEQNKNRQSGARGIAAGDEIRFETGMWVEML